ncbi:MAG: response regulator [Candidatus Zixiibacteriota bacterium]
MAKGKILIVDDEPDVLTYLQAVLENNGYETCSAESVEQGLKLLEGMTPDLVCLDIMMPRQLGLTLYARMKKDARWQNIPVLILSGVVQEEEFDFRNFIPDQKIPRPQDYLEKPIEREKFLETVERIIAQSRIGLKKGT